MYTGLSAGFLLGSVMQVREFKWLLRSTESLDFFLALSALGFGVLSVILFYFNIVGGVKISQHLLLAFSGLLSLIKLFWPARPKWITTIFVKGLVCVAFVVVFTNSMVTMTEIQIFYMLYAVGSFASLLRT